MSPDPQHTTPVTLWEPSGVNRPQCPLTFGVPFAAGELASPDALRLTDGDAELPLCATATSSWPDGSVRWALLDTQVSLRGNERKTLTLAFGAGASSAVVDAPLGVTEDGGAIAVRTGEIEAVFRNGGRMPFDALRCDGDDVIRPDAPLCSVTVGGVEYHAAGDSVTATVENANDLRAVVRCDGKFVADGEQMLDLTTRVYLYAGKRWVRIFHTVTNFEGRDVEVESLDVLLPTAVGKPAGGGATVNGLDSSVHRAVDGRVEVSAGTEEIPETRYDADELGGHVACKDRLGEIHGTCERRAQEYCTVRAGDGEPQRVAKPNYLTTMAVSTIACGAERRVALSCREFHHQAPKRQTLDGDEIRLQLYWGGDHGPLQFWRGTARTHELVLTIDDAGGELADEDVLPYKRRLLATHEPVAPTYGDSNRLTKSWVFGPWLEYQPKKYPWQEFLFRRMFDNWERNSAGWMRGTTILDYGDSWTPGRGGQWQNNEMDWGMGLLMFMLRTGYPKPLADVERIIHHMIDVDTHHEAPHDLWTGGQRYHQVRHGAFSTPTLCHQWLEGPLLFYLYTGYERAKEVAITRADHFCRMIEGGRHRVKQLERVQGWPLVALSTMNEYFPDQRYVDACEAILDWLQQWHAEDGDLVYPYMWAVVEGAGGGSVLGRGVIAQALTHYHRLTGSERAWRLLTTIMETARTTLLSPEGLGTKTSLLRRNYYAPGESDFILEAMGYLAEQTGDSEWMRLGILNYKLALIQRDPIGGGQMGVAGMASEAFRHWPPFLYYADRSGMLEDLKLY